MTNIINVYKSILKFAQLEPDEKGYINSTVHQSKEPILVDGLRLVLPTTEQLRNFDPTQKIIFHPLTENILRGESAVIAKLRDAINVRINYTTGVVMSSLLTLVASPELHKKLSPEQAYILTVITDCDAKTISNFLPILISSMKATSERPLCNIFLKKGGWKANVKFSRLAVISFPFYNKIEQLKVRQKDKETFRQMLEFIFLKMTDDEYSYGSNSRVAPFLDALMLGSSNIASRLNDILELYEEHIDEAKSLIFDSDWLEAFNNLEELIPEIRTIPSHAVSDHVEQPPMVEVAQQQPVVQQAMIPVPSGPISLSQALDRPFQPPQYQQQPQQFQQPTLAKSKNGLDFNSVKAINPSLTQQPNPLQTQLGFQNALAYQKSMMASAPQPQMYDQYGQPMMNQQFQQPQMYDQYGQPMMGQQFQQPQPTVIRQDHYGNLINQYNQRVDQYGNLI
jgi:hypothetical protein